MLTAVRETLMAAAVLVISLAILAILIAGIWVFVAKKSHRRNKAQRTNWILELIIKHVPTE